MSPYSVAQSQLAGFAQHIYSYVVKYHGEALQVRKPQSGPLQISGTVLHSLNITNPTWCSVSCADCLNSFSQGTTQRQFYSISSTVAR